MKFDPPIATRTTEELVAIAQFPDDWNAEAVKQATAELASRNVKKDEQLRIAKQLQKELNEYNDQIALERSQESYSYLDLFFLALKLPMTILSDWRLKADGFHTKHRQRLYAIGFGCILWIIGGFYLADTWKMQQVEWQNEVNNQDIYEWERDYYSDEEFASRRRESIESAIQTVKDNDARGIATVVILDSDTIQTSKIELLRDLDPLTIRDVVVEADPQTAESQLIRVKLVKKADNTRL
ncbi:MAG: hypothetical protein RIG68_28770 [Imperialibacter sp.]|uniref:hypothetical protein n=1 Tax=Imperialibacter sp. TaxID=2038411 RepID=UPI0032EFBB3C